MNVHIRIRQPDDEHKDSVYADDTAARNELHEHLEAHREAGHKVTPNASATVFTVTDEDGAFLEEFELINGP